MINNINKILLIEPPFYRLYKDTYSLDRYPLSLGYLSTSIKNQTDWELMVYNADFVCNSETKQVSYLAGKGYKNYISSLNDINLSIWKEIQDTIKTYKPSVVGISCKSQNYISAINVAKIAKSINKNIITVIGGPHPSMVGEEVLKNEYIDIAVKGEGEETIVEFLNAIINNKALSNINGIIYKENGKVIINKPREYIKDIDSLAFPHLLASSVLKDFNCYPKSAFKNIFATRGCPHNCFFCGSREIWSRKVRFRSVDNIISEILSLMANGINNIHFDDDTFGTSKDFIYKICSELLLKCPGLKWSCEIHVKLVDNEIIALMKKSGCFYIQLGIESGNNEMLKTIRKGYTIEEAIIASEIILKHKIILEGFFIIGFPQETEVSLNDTLNAIKRINCDVSYSIFTPYPGTEAFEYCKTNGLIEDNFNVSLYNHQSPENCFCLNISKLKFKELSLKIAKIVDNKNKVNRIKRYLSFTNIINRIKELGIRNTIMKLFQLFN